MRTVKEIFAADQILTLAVAKTLIGKTISVTNPEYSANSASVRTSVLKDIKSQWDLAAEEDFTRVDPKFATRQAYWESYMTDAQVKEMKRTLILVSDVQLNAGCELDSREYEEPTFFGSDEDRPIYYIVEDEN